jgi:putative membrane protein
VLSREVSDMMWHSGWGWGGWLAGGLMMLLFWGLLVAAVVVLVRGAGPQGRPGTPSTRDGQDGAGARRTLDERFARGELTEEEYLHRRELLAGR